MKLRQIISWFLVSIIFIGAGFYIYNDIYNRQKKTKDIQPKNSLYIKNIEKNQYEIEITPIESKKSTNIPIPELNKSIVFSDNFSDKEIKTITEKINKLIDELKKDNDSFLNWIELGLYRKLINDYEGAVGAWEYAGKIRPENSVSFGNLGDLYHFYLKDFLKSEENFRKAIENNPSDVSYYINLYELYKYSYKQDTNSAIDILTEGLGKNLGNTDLLVTLAMYYKEKGDTKNAKRYYEQARDEARKSGNTQLIQLLDEELSEFY